MQKKRKHTRKRGGSRRNSASVRQSPTIARKTTTKRNPAQRARRSSPRRNPLSVGGIKPLEIASAGAAVIVSQVALSLVPATVVEPGSWLAIGVELGLAIAARKFWPKGFYPDAAALAIGASAGAKAINKLTGFQNILTGFTANFLPGAPAGNGAGAGTAASVAVY